jgi:pimeloyl-ACP methyl ester carboxylesterase
MDVNGRALEVRRVAGRTPALVFLHEGLGCAGMWRDVPDRLAAATGRAALVYSRLGYGASDPAPPPWPVRFMHDEAWTTLPALLAAAGLEAPILVGHSDGASIALLHAARFPVAAVVALAPHLFVEDVTVASIARAAEAYATTDLRARLERWHGANVDGAFWGWNRVWLDPAFRSWNIEAEVAAVRAPLLVVQGTADPYGTLAQVDAIRRRAPGPVETLILDGCGHDPARERPDETLAAIVRHVAAIS